MQNPLSTCTVYVADFIFLYLQKQIFMYFYGKVDMIKF